MACRLNAELKHAGTFDPGVGSILDKVAKDTEDTSNLYLYLYLRYIFGQPVSYQYLQILGRAKDEIFFSYLLSYQQSQLEDNHFVLLHK